MRRRRRLIEDLEQRFGDGGRLEGQHARSMATIIAMPTVARSAPVQRP